MPDWLEIVLRTLLAIVVLFGFTKILGKRQISQLSLFEYITGISIGNIAAYVSLDLDNLWFLGIVSMSVWVAMSIGLEFLTMKSKAARDFVDGKGTVLIKDGQLLKHELHKERLTLDELLGQLRMKDVYRVADVEFAVMEATGEINVLLKKEYQPLTSDLMGWRVGKEHEAQTIIMDGVILNDALENAGFNREWLDHEIKRNKLEQKDIFLAQIDTDGKLSIQTGKESKQEKNDQTKPKERVGYLMEQYAAELRRLEQQSRNESDRRIYQNALDRFQASFHTLPDQLSKELPRH